MFCHSIRPHSGAVAVSALVCIYQLPLCAVCIFIPLPIVAHVLLPAVLAFFHLPPPALLSLWPRRKAFLFGPQAFVPLCLCTLILMLQLLSSPCLQLQHYVSPLMLLVFGTLTVEFGGGQEWQSVLGRNRSACTMQLYKRSQLVVVGGVMWKSGERQIRGDVVVIECVLDLHTPGFCVLGRPAGSKRVRDRCLV